MKQKKTNIRNRAIFEIAWKQIVRERNGCEAIAGCKARWNRTSFGCDIRRSQPKILVRCSFNIINCILNKLKNRNIHFILMTMRGTSPRYNYTCIRYARWSMLEPVFTHIMILLNTLDSYLIFHMIKSRLSAYIIFFVYMQLDIGRWRAERHSQKQTSKRIILIWKFKIRGG